LTSAPFPELSVLTQSSPITQIYPSFRINIKEI
jgi:hypothetical protein